MFYLLHTKMSTYSAFTLAAGYGMVWFSTAWYGMLTFSSVNRFHSELKRTELLSQLIQSYWPGTAQHSKLNPSVSLVVAQEY